MGSTHVVPSLLRVALRARCDSTINPSPPPCLLTAGSTPFTFAPWHSPIPVTMECGEAAGAGRSSKVGTDDEAVGAAQICTARHHGSPPPPPTPNAAARRRRHLLRHPGWSPSQIASSTSPAPAASAASCAGRRSPKMDSVDFDSMGWYWEQRIENR